VSTLFKLFSIRPGFFIFKPFWFRLTSFGTVAGLLDRLLNKKVYSVKIRLDYYFEAVKSLHLGARLFAAKLIFCPILSDLTTFLSAEGREEVAT